MYNSCLPGPTPTNCSHCPSKRLGTNVACQKISATDIFCCFSHASCKPSLFVLSRTRKWSDKSRCRQSVVMLLVLPQGFARFLSPRKPTSPKVRFTTPAPVIHDTRSIHCTRGRLHSPGDILSCMSGFRLKRWFHLGFGSVLFTNVWAYEFLSCFRECAKPQGCCLSVACAAQARFVNRRLPTTAGFLGKPLISCLC